MRWFQRSVAVSALVASSAASVASAQSAADIRRPKPVVMLLVDTSGSMERMPGAPTVTPDDDFPRCTGSSTSDVTQKNRWAVTLEALTGTFQDFTCRKELRSDITYKKKYDYNYYLPHYNFTTAADGVTPANQNTDGVIDAFAKRIKFGLMTFDGVNTTLGGESLVPLADFTDNIPFKEAVAGAPGIYSYGPARPLAFPGCEEVYGVNAGARAPGTHEGALIPVSIDGDGIVGVNETVQQSLLSVRPFGGTPIAGMLQDLIFYLQNDPSVKVGGTDVFAACRERYAILLTDGAPDAMFRDARFQCQSKSSTCPAANGGKCKCPYDTEVELAAQLRSDKLLKELLVVAFDVEDSAQEILDEIAQKGGERPALKASTPADLRKKLSGILGSVSRDAVSRTTPQIVDNGLPPYAGARQYEITAGFRIGYDADDPWEGLLYRRRFACQAGSNGGPPSSAQLDLSDGEGDMFHLALDRQAQISNGRKIVTVEPTPELAARGTIFGNRYSADDPLGQLAKRYEPTELNLPKIYNVRAPEGTFLARRPKGDGSLNMNQGQVGATSHVAKDFDTKLSRSLFGDADGNGVVGETDDLEKIVRYVRADPKERTPALADIYHSNPVVLPPLTSDSRFISTADDQLSRFLKNVATPLAGSTDPAKLDLYGTGGRPGTVFVGTNDGVLHAFNLDTWRGKDNVEKKAGHEFWGFVPPALFGKLAAAAAPTHQEMFDGTPQIRDMLLYRDASHVGTYGTVLLSAVRGAPAYVAMDITAAHEAPKFLWQFSAPAMGLTVATPALAQARILWSDDTTPKERAIAILPGGQGRELSDTACTTTLEKGKTLAKHSPKSRAELRCWEQRGRSLYVVDVATGQLIQEFDFQHFPSPLTGSVAVDGEGLDVSRAAYFTDQDGVLWRLSMADPDPSHWLVEPLWDLFHHTDTDRISLQAHKQGRPSIHPPLLSRDAEGNYIIIVATGDVDNLVEKVDTSNPPDPILHRLVSLKEERRLDTRSGVIFTGDVTANWDTSLVAGESVTGPLSLFNKALYFGSFVSPQSGNACDFGFSRLWGIHYMEKGADGKARGMFPNGVDASNKPVYVPYIDQGFEDSLVLGVSVSSNPVCVSGLVDNQFSPFSSKKSAAADALVGGGQYQIRAMVSGKGGKRASGSLLNEYSQTLSVPSEARFVGWGGSLE